MKALTALFQLFHAMIGRPTAMVQYKTRTESSLDPPSGNEAETPSQQPLTNSFTIDLIEVDGNDSRYNTLFDCAKARWESIVVGDLPDFRALDEPNLDIFDGLLSEPVSRDVDDVLIAYEVTKIDGVGDTLGFAGPVLVRLDDSDLPGATLTGIMIFDKEDFDRIQSDDVELIIIHEMAHVLGFGSLWEYKCGVDCLTKSDYRYTCPNAQTKFKELDLGGTLLLTDMPGEGSICAHWDDDSFPRTLGWSELMTPHFEANVRQLITSVTVGALQDLGYVVNYARADTTMEVALAKSNENEHIVLKPSTDFSLVDRVKDPRDMPDTIRSGLSL